MAISKSYVNNGFAAAISIPDANIPWPRASLSYLIGYSL